MERRVLPGLVLVSGFCGISYEILYGRLLGNLVGDQFAVNAAVLLTFLSGIGLGTLIAHRLWRHLWAIEAAVGGCALLFLVGTDTIEAWLYAQLPLLPGSVATAVLVCGLLLLVPALLIGCTLPLLAGYLRASVPGALFGRTYAVYNLGAAVTAIGIEFWLLRAVGLRGATALVAGLNGVVALLLATLFWSLRKEAPPASGVEPVGSRRAVALALVSVASAVFQLWMVKFAELLFGPFRETFALVLSLVFLGIAIGSYLVARFRLQFGGLLVANGLGLVWLLASTGWVASTYAVWCESAAESAPLTTLLKLGCLVALMGVPAATFGATVPALLGSERHPALESGRLLAISAFANAFGFLLMVLVLHRYLDYGVIILVAMTLVIAGLVVFRPKIVRSTLAGAGLLLGAIWIQQNVWEEELLFVGHPSFHSTEDLAKARRRLVRSQRFKGSLDVFSINRVGSKTYFFINGYNSMVLESPSEKLVGAFSAMLAPRTDRALVLGVGSGATAGTVALLFDHTDGVEISRVILENLHRMDAHNFGLARSDRATLIHDDAIHFVKGTEQTYSLIINTVTSPLYFSSSKLYTLDFFEAVRERLRPDGVYVTWVDSRVGDAGLDIILKSLADPFGQCWIAGIKTSYFLLLCSPDSVTLRHPSLIATNERLSRYFRENGLHPEWLPYGLLNRSAFTLIGDRTAPVNSLDRPVLEFHMARLQRRGIRGFKRRLRGAMRVEEVAAAVGRGRWDPQHLSRHAEDLYGDSSITDRWVALLAEARRTRSRDGRDD